MNNFNEFKEDWYLLQFKNRGKNQKSSDRFDEGNSFSCSMSRPSGGWNNRCNNRMHERKYVKDIKNYHLTDLVVTENGLRKSVGRKGEGLKQPHTNLQHHRVALKSPTYTTPNVRRSFCIETECIKISVSDIYSYKSHLKENEDIDQMIVFSPESCARCIDFSNVVVVPYTERDFASYSWSFSDIRRLFAGLCKKVKKHDHTLIVCTKGVNRSVGLAMVCLMYFEKMTFENALNLIEDKKMQVDKRWSTLTNIYFRNIIHALHTYCQPQSFISQK